MVRIDNAPVPDVQSHRKVGLEIEIAVGSGDASVLKATYPGWSRHCDGSIGNGWEYVFDGPVLLSTAKTRITAFCTEVKDVNVHQRGGFHVHVQGINYSKDDCYWLAFLYTKFQGVINNLVAPSRVGNTYCRSYPPATFSRGVAPFIHNVCLTQQDKPTRYAAKHVTGRYRTVNLNMMACANEHERSIEFRQGSVSKRFGVVWGWTCFLVALTEMAKFHDKVRALPNTCSLEAMLDAIHSWEVASGSTGVTDWVRWRHAYLNQKPDDAELRKALEAIAESPVGLYGLSRKIDINLAVCRRIIEDLKRQALIFKGSGSAYRASYEFKAEADLLAMVAVAKTKNTLAAVAAVPAEADRPIAVAGLTQPPVPEGA